jgi:CheY-like chemotaxis protein
MTAKRILIADDEADFIGLLQWQLAGQGHEFMVAGDGVSALEQARRGKPDLILLDILMPDLDGLSVCEMLRRQPETKTIPIIVMSALCGDVTRRTAAMHAAVCTTATVTPAPDIVVLDVTSM